MKKAIVMSDFYCTVCGNRTSLPRKKSSLRKRGHTKTMFCFCCQKETDFLEIKDTEFRGSFHEYLHK